MGSYSDLLSTQDINHSFFLTTCGYNYVRREIKHFHSLPFSQFAKTFISSILSMSDICSCTTEKLQLGFGVNPKARVTSAHPSISVFLPYHEIDAHGHHVLF